MDYSLQDSSIDTGKERESRYQIMKKYKTKIGKLTITLGCVAALTAAGLGGCGKADMENKTKSEKQMTAADTPETDTQKTESRGANIRESDTREVDIQETGTRETEAESGTLDETGLQPLPGENVEFQKVTSENGDEAYFGSRTTVVLDGETIDIKDRVDSVNGILGIKSVDGYWIVEGHISPNVGYYGFYNIETRQWDKEFLGVLLTWYGADETDDDIPFSMDTVVYEFWNGLYDSNGTLLRTIEVDEDEYEYIHELKRVSTGVEVYILNAEMEERMVMVDIIPQTESGIS